MAANNPEEDEEYAFREQIQEAMAASAQQQQPTQADEQFLMALRFQEMLENQFSASQKKTNDFTHKVSYDRSPNINNNEEEEWKGVVEEYKKLNLTMEELQNASDEWNDAVQEFDDADTDNEDFSEALSCRFEDYEEQEVDGGFFSLYFKGVSWGDSKPGPSASAIGVVIRRSQGGEVVLEVQKKLGYYVEKSVAEHLALIEGLAAALEHGLRRVNAFTDSTLVYDQVARGRRLEKDELLLAVRQRVFEHVRKLDDFVLRLVDSVESADSRNAIWMAQEALHNTEDNDEEEEEEEEEEDAVLYVGLGQKRQRRFSKGSTFHAPASWSETENLGYRGETSKFSQHYPRTQVLGMHSWREREKGIGEWKFL